MRYDQLGEEINLSFDCQYCKNKVTDFVANLEDIDIDCKVGEYDEVVPYKLKKPITLEKGQRLVDSIKIGLAKWDVLESADRVKSIDEASMKEHTFRRSILGIMGDDTPILADDIIKKMKKIDIELLHGEISKHNAGPSIQAEVECSKCGKSFLHQIDWGYEGFFGIGSLPQR